MAEPLISRVYDIQITGYDENLKKLKSLTEEFKRLDGAKKKLNSELKTKVDSNEIQILKNSIKDLTIQMEELLVKRKSLDRDLEFESSGALKAMSAYNQLRTSYQQALANAREMSAQFGVESVEAKAATEALMAYKAQMSEINNLIKNGSQQTAPEIPFSHNLDQLEEEANAIKETGVVVSDLDKAQADATMTAIEWANAQKQVNENLEGSSIANAQALEGYEKYTGTLRENVLIQIENANALKANRIEQKEIEEAIKASGTASAGQISRLGELKQESILLTETNRQLTTTIKNQTREYMASTGSMEQMQAKINQLQQAYSQLSESERDSPFGREMKKEIDTLEPKIKTLEASIGRFQRNVGNYPTIFAGAFKELNAELDKVQAKLASGNFKGAELDQLVAKQNALAKANALVNKEFATSTSQANAFKQAANEVGLAYGTNSEFASSFADEVKKSDTAITSVSDSFNKASTSGKGFLGVITKLYAGIRTAANIIPGLGISGVILLLLGPLQAAGAAIASSVKKSMEAIGGLSEEAKKKIEELEKATKSINEEYIKGSTASILKLELFRDIITDTTRAQKERLAALNDYNKIADEANKLDATQIDNLNLINSSISRQIDLIGKRALTSASEKIVADKAEKLLLAEENVRRDQKIEDDAYNIETVEGAKTDAYFLTLERQGAIRKRIAEDAAVIQARAEFEAAKQIAKVNLDRTGYVGSPETKTKTKKTKSEENAELKLIEINRARLIALENNARNEILKSRELTFNEEKEYLYRIENINVEALNKKIDLLNQKKKLNAEEKKQLAEYAEQRSSFELSTSKKINDLLQKDFDERQKKFKEMLDQEIALVKEANRKIQEDPEASPSTKAQSQVNANEAILKAQISFFLQMDALEKVFNKVSIKNATERAESIQAANEDLNKNLKSVPVALLSDIDQETDKAVNSIKLKYAQLVEEILKTNKSVSSKDKAIKVLLQVQEVEVKGTQQKGLNKALVEARELYDLGKISLEEYISRYEKAVKGQEALTSAIEKGKEAITSVRQLAGSSLSNLFGFAAGSEDAKHLGEIITQAFDIAGQAMNNYYDQEAARIERSNQTTQKKLDIELQQALARSQSQAETESLERQFAARKDEADREAFEKNKKLQIEQAKINLGIQLSNLAVVAFAPSGPNLATLGIAGAIMYAVQSALALVNYGVNVSRIQSASYDKGGFTGPGIKKDHTGHKVAGVVHDNEWVSPKWMVEHPQFGPMIRELEAVRVKGFAAGGFTSTMAYPGKNFDRLQPPVNPSSFLNPGSSKANVEALAAKTDAQINKLTDIIEKNSLGMNHRTDKLLNAIHETSRQTNQRIDKVKVILNPNEVEDSNNQTKKAVNIGRV